MATITMVKHLNDFFPFRVDPFSEGGWLCRKQTEVTNVVSHVKLAEVVTSVYSALVI